jgi:hypothetical protein
MSAHLPRRTALLSLILAAGLLWPAPTAAAPSAPHTGPAPTNTCLIYSLYRDILGRQADSAGLAAGLIYLGSHTHGEYALTLLTLDEYRILLIRGWYHGFLGRPATMGEIDTQLSSLNGGAKDENVMAFILGSGEYFNQARVGGTNSGFVTAIYQDLLGRSPSPSDLTTWVGFLGTHTRGEMAQILLTSAEYQTDIIQAWYHRFLSRAASPGEVTAARGALNGAGGTDEQVIAVVLGSVEYFSRAGLCTTYLPLVRR